MYGAMIGDIVGSKYEFNNIKTKKFPLFSMGCDYTDDTIMTVAVAKAILRSRELQRKDETDPSFQKILIESMQDFGRRYPNPTGAYGGNFAKWLQAKDPQPYGRVYHEIDTGMAKILKTAKAYLPQEFIDVAEQFHEVCWHRAGTYGRVGFCSSILSKNEVTAVMLLTSE